ncbi:PhzF family phenazine biosynthesis protein [Priestia koreensis]|uniref:PhzF family phenazine biosynthesis protein n=1 Tax=Priestia koreensis TaxID=284581 RepID=UPI001F5A8424|nr:PhzF family phenazine biosynthesis protein [Priestia koreensis]UNL82887.1 PhzF family phenazine biosynthesis protein [Priestia koreensis]
MKEITVYHYEAFSDVPHKGNPAGVVFGGESLTDEDMQRIARQVGFNETSFPVPSAVADVRIRYFTPGHEMDLCGHATVATIFALRTHGLLPAKEAYTIETKAGILPVRVTEVDNRLYITLQQATPQFRHFHGDRGALALAMNLTEDDLDLTLPIMYGSTGIWTLLVPIKTLASFSQMKPYNDRFPSILKEMPNASLHPFCLETVNGDAHMHARHFSSPFSGTTEDPVTGTASGVMGAYYQRYIQQTEDAVQLVIEQGSEMNRDGRVHISISPHQEVEMSGNAVFVKKWTISL